MIKPDSSSVNAELDEKALRESDLLAFEFAVEINNPASVMCAYNFVNGVRACQNDFLNSLVLKASGGGRALSCRIGPQSMARSAQLWGDWIRNPRGHLIT